MFVSFLLLTSIYRNTYCRVQKVYANPSAIFINIHIHIIKIEVDCTNTKGTR